ncbi:ABC transporter permease [Prescottella subtropica]|uniref:ABC transporter permease n=1 Tax=Prescottella subtropica TaxID=2545757 RepID=UPI0010F86235|nr:ABC transporter permease [Prescottella subtropica]
MSADAQPYLLPNSPATAAADAEVAESRAKVPGIGAHRRPNPTGLSQWWALTARAVAQQFRNGTILISVLAPFITGLGFYLPLKYIMKFQGIDYAQFILPIVVLQSMSYTVMNIANTAARESVTGLTARMQTMPVASLAPLMSRISVGVVQSLVSLAAATAFGYLIGFRFTGNWLTIVLFCLVALVFATVLSFGADMIGCLTRSPEATAQALTLPQLILGMMSCGFVPESGFPEWVRPFVRNQPVSQYSFALRDLAEGHINWNILFPSFMWTVGLAVVLIPMALWASTRRK